MSFVKFTLGDIRASVRRKLDDLSFDAATIDEAANDFQFEIFNDNRIRFMEANAVLSILNGSATVDLPDDFMNMINLTVFDTASTPRDITKSGAMSYDDFMRRFSNFATANPSKVFNYTFFGEGLRFGARSNANYNANLDYTRSPALMTDAASECELPINARELMTLGTLERVMRVNEDYNEADFEYDRLQGLRTAFIKNYARGGEKVGAQVINSGRNGRRVGGYRADRDF
jgi:hypothetical protein